MQKLQLSIPTPCHENWENMTPEGQGRFCGSCAKQVIDFSTMTDNQLLLYFANLKNENVCGRVYPDQLNRTFVAPEPARKKIWLYWQYVLALLMFFFARGQQTKAQSGIPKTALQPAKPGNINEPVRIMLGGIRRTPTTETAAPRTVTSKKISVQDDAGERIPLVTAELLPSGRLFIAGEDGILHIANYRAGDSIKISSVDHEAKTVAIKEIDAVIIITRKIKTLGEVTVNSTGQTQGKLIMAGGISYGRVIKSNSLKDTLQNIFSFAGNDVRVFPNPAKQGNSIHLSVKLKKSGTYKLIFSDVAGKQLQQQNLIATANQEFQQVTVPVSWASGLYFVQMVDEKNKQMGTAKFIVE